MRKVLLILCLLCCFLLPTTARAATGEVEVRNTEFAEEEICNRNGKTLIQCRLAWVGYGGNAFYLDNFKSVYIGNGEYRAQDIVEIVIVWNPDTNYSDDCIISVRPVRVWNRIGTEEKGGGVFV